MAYFVMNKYTVQVVWSLCWGDHYFVSQPGPFFLNSNKVALSKHQFVTCIRSILQLLGLLQFDYAGHSFRIGAATTVATAGVEDSMIQTLGSWQSAEFLQYICNFPDSLTIWSITVEMYAQLLSISLYNYLCKPCPLLSGHCMNFLFTLPTYSYLSD